MNDLIVSDADRLPFHMDHIVWRRWGCVSATVELSTRSIWNLKCTSRLGGIFGELFIWRWARQGPPQRCTCCSHEVVFVEIGVAILIADHVTLVHQFVIRMFLLPLKLIPPSLLLLLLGF